LIGHVTPGGPAAGAGLVAGDIVTAIDGKAVADSRAMQKLIVESEVGRKLKVRLRRKGMTPIVSVRVGRRSE
jgi:serine protease Do